MSLSQKVVELRDEELDETYTIFVNEEQYNDIVCNGSEMNQNVEECLDMDNVDIERVALHMSQYGSGKVSLLDTYWSEGIAIMQINNIQKGNAISGKMMVDFRNCVAKLESWKNGKAVILYGCGKNFCSGGDLDFARQCNTEEDGIYLSTLMHDVLKRLEKLPLLSVALIHGPTLGGGAEIAVACDYILACNNTKLGFVHGLMGIMTAWGATTRLVKAIGEKKALELLLTSKILEANECLNMGLVSEILDNENALELCLAWTRARTKHNYNVTRAFKQVVIAQTQMSYDEALNYEKKLFAPFWGSEANKDSLRKNIKHVKS